VSTGEPAGREWYQVTRSSWIVWNVILAITLTIGAVLTWPRLQAWPFMGIAIGAYLVLWIIPTGVLEKRRRSHAPNATDFQ
jgi:hypothetical protein